VLLNGLLNKSRLLVLLVLPQEQVSVSPAAQQVSSAKEAVPDWLAWLVFHESVAFNSKQPTTTPAASSTSEPKKSLFSGPRPTTFEQAMKKQFGLSPDHVAVLLTKGQSFLAELDTIQNDAKEEVSRRYLTPATLTRQASNLSKAIKQRAKEDGLDDQVNAKRQAVLDKHLSGLSQSLTSTEFAKVTEWVRTKVAPRIILTTLPEISRGATTGAARTPSALR
jgi:hypothetical protein